MASILDLLKKKLPKNKEDLLKALSGINKSTADANTFLTNKIGPKALASLFRPQTGTLATAGRQLAQNIARTPIPQRLQQPLTTGFDVTNRFLQNRIVQPIKDIPQNFGTLTAPRSSLVQRGLAGLSIAGALSPGPEDLAFGLYERQKARAAAKSKGASPEQITRAGRSGLTGETFTPAGEALGITNPLVSKTVSGLELPALLAVGALKAKGIKKLAPEVEAEFVNIGRTLNKVDDLKITGLNPSEEMGYLTGVKRSLDPIAKKLGISDKAISSMSPNELYKVVGTAIRASKDVNIPIGFQAKAAGGQDAIREAEDLTKGIRPQKVSSPDILERATGISPSTKVSESGLSLGSILPQKGKINVDRLDISDEAKQLVTSLQDNVPVTVIGNKDVVGRSALTKGAKRPMTDEQMVERMASQLNSRQTVVDLTKQFDILKKNGGSEAEQIKLLGQIADQSRLAQQEGTFAGRLLQSRNILANELATPMQKIFALLENAGVKPDKYLKDAAGVNWDNPSQVVSFYRKFVSPKLGEVIDEYRYTNMLSSPLTQITNAFGNAIQSLLVAPTEKTISGVLDWTKSRITGAERKYYATDGISYLTGAAKNLPTAFRKLANVVSGKEVSLRPDLEYIPTSPKGISKLYTTPLRLLEGMDQFFRSIVSGGEREVLKRFKLPETDVVKRADQAADYRLFRQAFDPEGKLGQGHVLRTWDKYNQVVSGLRRLPGGKWIVPFLQTPTNILKQGLEYSPLGVTTLPGATNKVEQLSKAIIGTGVYTTAYSLLNSVPFTWSEPTDPNGRSQFYAAGMQPYSIKLGDKWVSFSKLGPLSYPIAMASALRYAEKANPDSNTLENVSKALGGILTFFGDQSYVKEIGDLMDELRSDRPDKFNRFIESEASNVAEQMVPYRSFLGWLTRTIDPVYRKAENIGERIMTGIPGLSGKVSPYYNVETGDVSRRPNPILNALSPLRVGDVQSVPGQVDASLRLGIPFTGGATERARAIYSKMKQLPPEEFQRMALDLKKNDQGIFNAIKKIVKEEDMGIEERDRELLSQDVGTGERAGSLAEEFKRLKTKEEKAALWDNYVKKGVITKEVANQLAKMLSK